MKHLPLFSGILLVLALSGCTGAYYGAAEQIGGMHKRDILVSRVGKAKTAQQETKDQFADALEQFQSVVRVDGGDLEAKYRKLKASYDRSAAKARAVKARNDEVDHVARALFREWERELKQYTNPNLRSSSQAQLRETQARYSQLISAMRRAEAKIDPVLGTFQDQVLYLKHNLNARAIGSLQSELRIVEANTAALIREMNASIAEANRFISAMR